jgi:hypothetical protein
VLEAYVPGEHELHEDSPVESLYVPLAHLVHEEARVSEYLPASHTVQFCDSPVLKVPGSQEVQVREAIAVNVA